jgi:hypothetical protein
VRAKANIGEEAGTSVLLVKVVGLEQVRVTNGCIDASTGDSSARLALYDVTISVIASRTGSMRSPAVVDACRK